MATSVHNLGVDWSTTLASLRRRVASHLRGWAPADIEDCAQDAALRVIRVARREGWPRNPNGLYSVVARRAAIDFIRTRSRRPFHEPFDETVAPPHGDSADAAVAELHEEVRSKALRIFHYFSQYHSRCEGLARARAEGMNLKHYAEQSGQSHAAVLQQWSRCMKRLFDAIRRGQLSWPWPLDEAHACDDR